MTWWLFITVFQKAFGLCWMLKICFGVSSTTKLQLTLYAASLIRFFSPLFTAYFVPISYSKYQLARSLFRLHGNYWRILPLTPLQPAAPAFFSYVQSVAFWLQPKIRNKKWDKKEKCETREEWKNQRIHNLNFNIFCSRFGLQMFFFFFASGHTVWSKPSNDRIQRRAVWEWGERRRY